MNRRTAYYRDSVLLARAVIRNVGRSPLAGGEFGWTFLIRTPEAVEEALRLWLAEKLSNAFIRKEGQQLSGTRLTLTPAISCQVGYAPIVAVPVARCCAPKATFVQDAGSGCRRALLELRTPQAMGYYDRKS